MNWRNTIRNIWQKSSFCSNSTVFIHYETTFHLIFESTFLRTNWRYIPNDISKRVVPNLSFTQFCHRTELQDKHKNEEITCFTVKLNSGGDGVGSISPKVLLNMFIWIMFLKTFVLFRLASWLFLFGGRWKLDGYNKCSVMTVICMLANTTCNASLGCLPKGGKSEPRASPNNEIDWCSTRQCHAWRARRKLCAPDRDPASQIVRVAIREDRILPFCSR